MKKLTDQQIRDAVNGAGLMFTHPDLIVARAIEAEVLRINGWQPIETAPRDGTSVLIYMPEASRKKVMEAYWSTPWDGAPEDQCWWGTPHGPAGRGYTILPKAVTHWMRLPAAPGNHIGDANKMVESVNAGKNVPFEAGTWDPDADGFWPELCSECGTPVRYGSRHSRCGENAQAKPRATGCPDTLRESFASVGANGDTLGETVQSLRRDLEQWEQNEVSRALGCPDTMDDMGRFAVNQKAAGEEKSPPATGPAG